MRGRGEGGARGGGRRTPSIERGSFDRPYDSMRCDRGQNPNSDVTREKVRTSVLCPGLVTEQSQDPCAREKEEEREKGGPPNAREGVVRFLAKDLPLEHLHELCAVNVPAPGPELPRPRPRVSPFLEVPPGPDQSAVDLGLFEDPGRVDALYDARGPARDLAALEDEARRAERVGGRVEGPRDDV